MDEKMKKAMLEHSREEEPAELAWEYKVTDDMIMGEITARRISVKYKTPYLVLKTEEEPEVHVYIKSGLIYVMIKQGWLKKNDDGKYEWTDAPFTGEQIAVIFQGKKKAEDGDHKFHKFRVYFQEELEENKWI